MTNKEYVNSHLSDGVADVPGFPKPGIIFKDIVPSFENPIYAKHLIGAFVDEINEKGIKFDKILCPESRGFLFGIPLGLEFSKGVVLARKFKKLPRGGLSVTYDLEYGQATLQISEGSISKGDKILIVDDLLATGGSSKALVDLVEKSGAEVAGIIFFLELTPLKGREKIKNYNVMSITKVEAY